jgi:hypothetical protein
MVLSAPIGLQRWRSLLFVHWEVPLAVLRRHVPPELEIDTFQGKAYVTLIPFDIPEVRPFKVLPGVPTAARFLETNLRTYVKHGGEGGIWFFSLEAESTLAVAGARFAYGLPYFRADMRMESSGPGGNVHYRSQRLAPGPRPADLTVDYIAGEPIGVAAPGTLEHFLVERYTLFSQHWALGLVRANVRHQPYPLRRATVSALTESLTRAAGLTDLGARAPDLYSDGVDVDIFAPERVR